MTVETIPLFPQPLARFWVDPLPWQDLLRGEPMQRRELHWYSESNRVLDSYAELRNQLQDAVDGFSDIYGFTDRSEITISWLNENRQGDSTHQHQHPNSIFSGCWYWDVIDTTEIHFHRQPTGSLGTWVIKLDQRETEWTTDTTVVRVRQGDLLIWPSFLQHSVPGHQGRGRRRTLAFNTMPRSWGSDLYAVPPPR